MPFPAFVALAAQAIEGAGVLILLLGGPAALVALLLRRRAGASRGTAYTDFRRLLGRAILLGLEFLVAADIIRTVSEHPTLSSVAVLASIVLVRTFLSFTLHLEIEGRWPWQKSDDAPE